jgi:hypothetical protein
MLGRRTWWAVSAVNPWGCGWEGRRILALRVEGKESVEGILRVAVGLLFVHIEKVWFLGKK